jgi:hypothetical protein
MADFQAAMKAWRMACVAPTPAIEGSSTGESLLVASKLPTICMAWPSSRRPKPTLTITMKYCANDRYVEVFKILASSCATTS